VAQLVDRQRGRLERHRSHADEAPGMPPDDLGHVRVLHPREALGGLGVHPVAEHHRRRRECLHVDAQPVHILQPPGRIPRAIVDVAEELRAGEDRRAAPGLHASDRGHRVGTLYTARRARSANGGLLPW